MKFIFAYAYDVAHYADFVVEADSPEAAEVIATKALNDGRFSGVDGSASNDIVDERVFICATNFDGEAEHLPMLDEIAPPITPKKEG